MSAARGTCSTGSSCPPRRSPGWLGSLWATAARSGRAAAAAGGGGMTAQAGSDAVEAGPIDRGSAAADAAADDDDAAAAAACSHVMLVLFKAGTIHTNML